MILSSLPSWMPRRHLSLHYDRLNSTVDVSPSTVKLTTGSGISQFIYCHLRNVLIRSCLNHTSPSLYKPTRPPKIRSTIPLAWATHRASLNQYGSLINTKWQGIDFFPIQLTVAKGMIKLFGFSFDDSLIFIRFWKSYLFELFIQICTMKTINQLQFP